MIDHPKARPGRHVMTLPTRVRPVRKNDHGTGRSHKLNNNPLIPSSMTSDLASEFQLQFFKDNGFIRKVCPKCGRAYWSQGDGPPAGSRLVRNILSSAGPRCRDQSNVHEMREAYLSFFEENGHGRVRRYPIVARWRDDVFFTQASNSMIFSLGCSIRWSDLFPSIR